VFLFYSALGGENVYNVLSLYPKQLVVILKMAGFLVTFLLHFLLEVANHWLGGRVRGGAGGYYSLGWMLTIF
jgi:hypothetical protein